MNQRKCHLMLEKLREPIFLVLLANYSFDCYHFRCTKIRRKCDQFSMLLSQLWRFYRALKLLSGFNCWLLNMHLSYWTYIYYFICRVRWEVAPRQKPNLLRLQLSRFSYYVLSTFLSFEHFHNLRAILVSQGGSDNKALVTLKNDNVSASNGEA